jgi:hypothetical protein
MIGDRIHFPVTRRIKHQTILVCINAARETFCSQIVTPDFTTRGVFRDDIEEDVELKLHVSRSGYVDVKFIKVIDVMCLFLRSKVTGKQKKFSMFL